jgi:hypothetical protein
MSIYKVQSAAEGGKEQTVRGGEADISREKAHLTRRR